MMKRMRLESVGSICTPNNSRSSDTFYASNIKAVGYVLKTAFLG